MLEIPQYRKALEECHLLQVLLDFNPGDQTAIKATGSMAPDMQVGTGAFTLEAWIYLTGTGKNTILSNMTDNGGGVLQGYQWYIENNEMHLLMGDNTNSSTLHIQTSGSGLQANQWYHVAVTRQGNDANTNYYLYVNNTAQALQVNSNQLTTGDISGGYDLHIGAYPNTINSGGSYTDYFEGYISHVRVYKKALNSGEITANYQSGCFGKPQVLTQLIYDGRINDAGTGITNYAGINNEGQVLGNNTQWVFEAGNSNCYNANTQVLCEFTNGMGRYRFGFNGQEIDNEVAGAGNITTAEYWEYDTRLGRRWNIDPVTNPSESPLATFSNNPVLLNDPNGDCATCPKDGKKGDIHTTSDAKPFNAPNGQLVSGTDGQGVSVFLSDQLTAVTYLNTGENSWQAVGFETKGGARYTWSNEKNWYVDKNGNEFDDHLSFDATNMVGGAMLLPIQVFTDQVKNNDAFKSFREAYYAHGGSISSFVWDGFKENVSNLFAGGHTGTQAWGSMYMGYLSSGGFVGLNIKSSFSIGGSFRQYKKAVGGTRTLGTIETFDALGNPVLQRVSVEYHHVLITQRMQNALGLPNWMVNNSLNVWRLNTIQHSIIDSYRFNFLRPALKPQVGLFKKYNWTYRAF